MALLQLGHFKCCLLTVISRIKAASNCYGLYRWWSVGPFHHDLRRLLEVVLQRADQLVLVEGDDAGDAEQEEHQSLDRQGSPGNSAQEPVGAGEDAGVDQRVLLTETQQSEQS